MSRSGREKEFLRNTKAYRRPLRTRQEDHLYKRKSELVDFQRSRNRDIVFVGEEDSRILFSPYTHSKNLSDFFSVNKFNCLSHQEDLDVSHRETSLGPQSRS